MVLPPLSVLAERANRLGEARVVRGERAGVAHRSEILRRVEAERAREPGGAGAEAVALGPVRLAGILDDREPGLVGERPQRPHVGHLPVEVHRQQERACER